MKLASIVLLAGAFVLPAATFSYADEIVFSPERETVVREYIVKHPATAVEAPDDFDYNVGAVVPMKVTPVPVDVPDSTYDYATVGKRTIIIDRPTRKIIHVYD